MRRIPMLILLLVPVLAASSAPLFPGPEIPRGYYRYPAIHGDTIVFTAEGDLWSVGVPGGVARRLTSHLDEESRAAISPDGTTIAFSASYEGPTEVYTMPIEGGLPVRRTWDGAENLVAGWTPDGRILVATRRFATLPDTQLVVIDPRTGAAERLPLAQASDGSYDEAGKTLFFTRLAFQGSHTKRYKGGTVQNIWRFGAGDREAVPLTADFAGTSKNPMWWRGRVYFASDRDGTMNIWSMKEDGSDLRQHTSHSGWDVKSPSLSGGRIAYQIGADVHVLDVAAGKEAPVPIRLASDFDQMRERWVKDPMEYVTALHASPNGDRVVLTARGQIFVAPAQQGRLVEATRRSGVRYRQARFMPDGKSLVTLSDESGEVELWSVPANGVGAPERLTDDGTILRLDSLPSPDGKWIAHADKNQKLWLWSAASRKSKLIAACETGDFADLAWSPDSRWLAYAAPAANFFQQISIYDTESGSITALTSDRYDSGSPAWSPDGRWIYFLSDRNLESLVGSPWGTRQPEPFFDRSSKIYEVALQKGQRSPFRPADELAAAETPKKEDEKAGKEKAEKSGSKEAGKPDAKAPSPVAIDLEGIQSRISEVPAPPGNYEALSTDGKRLYWIARETSVERKASLKALTIDNKRPDPETFMDGITSYELSADGSKILVRKETSIYVFEAGTKAPSDLSKSAVNLREWTFALDPREEWRQMYLEAWRLERDYFYDPKMHGVDWPAIRDKYLPLADRVTDRAELSDLLAQMVGELSALHIFVRGGDARDGIDQIAPAALGAVLARDEKAGGFRIDHIYKSDPDRPDRLSPLARPEVGALDGDVIETINGVATLSVPDPHVLLRGQAGKQVLLRIRPKGGGASRDVIATPISAGREADLRYDEWEYTRRLRVEEIGGGKIGYVHLRAMGGGNIAEWAREFYPVFDRQGLIVDVRHNRGGNIDSWILEKLMRRAWLWWQPRVGRPYSNMQSAFRGHMVALCDARTASDGEMFAEGFRRFGLGKLIGTRTWGGEIWLTSSNFLVDRGIATAAEFGVYGPEGQWLIEGHGVDPDIVVDNLPHATFLGDDAQLDAAVKHLLQKIADEPLPLPPAPPYPDKSGRAGTGAR